MVARDLRARVFPHRRPEVDGYHCISQYCLNPKLSLPKIEGDNYQNNNQCYYAVDMLRVIVKIMAKGYSTAIREDR